MSLTMDGFVKLNNEILDERAKASNKDVLLFDSWDEVVETLNKERHIRWAILLDESGLQQFLRANQRMLEKRMSKENDNER